VGAQINLHFFGIRHLYPGLKIPISHIHGKEIHKPPNHSWGSLTWTRWARTEVFLFLKTLMCLRGSWRKLLQEQPQMMRPFSTALVLSVMEFLLHYFLFKLCLLKSIWDVPSSNISCFHSNLSFEVSSWIYRKTDASQYWKSVRKLQRASP